MRLFGSERLMSVFNALGVPEGEQIQHKMLTSAIEKAQEKIEYNNYGIRKNLLEYDQVNNDQREIIYKAVSYTHLLRADLPVRRSRPPAHGILHSIRYAEFPHALTFR